MLFLTVCSWYYGCGLGIPTHLEGMEVLDLGSGAGRDCFIIANLVGSEGHVTGIDMTEEQVCYVNREQVCLVESQLFFSTTQISTGCCPVPVIRSLLAAVLCLLFDLCRFLSRVS